MAIINHSREFVFVHVPKAAGTSITSLLSRYTSYCDQEIGGTDFGERLQPAYQRRFGLAKHSTALALRNLVGEERWSRYFTFSFVRDPFARALSTFHFLRKWEGVGAEVGKLMRSFQSFEEYVLSEKWDSFNGPDSILLPQVHWLRAGPNATQLLVDFVGRVERIEEDLAHVLRIIDPPESGRAPGEVPRLNRSADSSPAHIRDARVIEKIVRRYAEDFAAFSYPRHPAG